jgi:hypothetical protein
VFICHIFVSIKTKEKAMSFFNILHLQVLKKATEKGHEFWNMQCEEHV